jgi:hypothetical protein
MHARNRTWPLGSDPAERCRQRTLPVEGGDGSTLSLDFTTGVLDPRLTFTRLSNATFINSSGLVKYAEQNLFFNTNFAGISGSNPTLSNVGWSYGFTAGTATFNGDGSVTMSASGGRCTINRITSFAGSGRRIIVSVDITSNGDTGLIPTQLLRDGTLTNSVYYINSNLYTSGTVVGPCTLTFVADSPTAANSTPFFGVGTSGNVTATVTFARPRFGLWDGTFPLPYVVNTSSGASPSEYHGPRFDHDPTTLSPQGLLIEGSAVNRLFQSSAFSTSPWGPSGYDLSGTGYTSPDGSTLALRWTAGTGAISPGNVQLCSNVTSTSVTLSVWWRNGNHTNSTPNNLRRVAIRNSTTSTILLDVSIVNPATVPSVSYNTGSTGASLTAYQDGWYRLVLTVSSGITSGNNIQAYIGGLFGSVTGAGEYCYWWGAMLEDGSGASSYIPTGASQGSRSADECLMDATNFAIGSWYTAAQGTFYTDVEYTALSGNQSGIQLADNSGGSETNRLSIRRGIAIATRGGTTARQFTPTATARAKSAFAYGTADYRFSQNGATFSGIAGDNGASPSSIDRIRMFAPGPTQIYGWLRAIKFWPISQSQSFINALTTL